MFRHFAEHTEPEPAFIVVHLLEVIPQKPMASDQNHDGAKISFI